jgi:uncharacterized membrane protein
MTPWIRQISARVFFGVFTFTLLVMLLGLVLLAPPDGNERAELLQFIGRFHPLSVHLPIAILLLVPIFELAGRSRYFPYLLPSVNFLLALAVCGAVMAAILGWCLARGGGSTGPLVIQHMWGGLSVAAVEWLCWVLRFRSERGESKRLYAAMLVASVGLVSFTGYRGGQLSQGENHLTEYMPASLRTLFGLRGPSEGASSSPNGGTATFFGARIQPIFGTHCVNCHGQNKHKANLRLDTYDAVMKGGKHGAVIKAGEPLRSELIHRVTLPPSDDDFMPADHKRPLSAGDVKLIEIWITAGASGTKAADDIKDVPLSATSEQAVAEVNFEEIDPQAVARQRASAAAVISELQQRFPNILDYQSRASAELVLNASLMGAKFGDAELAAFSRVSERIVVADFSSTAITDRSAGFLATMKHVRSLRLMHTKVTDATVKAFGSLEQLESLNLFDTSVTPAAMPAIAALPRLRHVYVSGTKISAGTSLPDALKQKIVF